jgi:hypothetical protein
MRMFSILDPEAPRGSGCNTRTVTLEEEAKHEMLDHAALDALFDALS